MRLVFQSLLVLTIFAAIASAIVAVRPTVSPATRQTQQADAVSTLQRPTALATPRFSDANIRLVGNTITEPKQTKTGDQMRRLPEVYDSIPDLSDLPSICTSQLPSDLKDLEDSQAVSKQPAMVEGHWPPTEPNEAAELHQTLLPNVPYNPHPKATSVSKLLKQDSDESKGATDPHAEVFGKSCYPSATECRKCHEQLYEEWAVSSHAYSAVSPMFHKFEQRINSLAQGTLGYFCMRCHAPVATTEKHPRWESILNGPRVWREGVTCVACHRVVEAYGKTNGERRMEPGPLEAPIVGSGDGKALAAALRYPEEYKLKTDPAEKRPGQVVHNRVIQFQEISNSTFCLTCHQVAVQPGIKLEVVWEQYRHSPAFRQGIRCQDCHMGKVPGLAQGFCKAPAAIVNDKPFGAPRKHSNHVFFGPGYSIAHPGIFPQNPAADRWPARQWLTFDWRAGWGTEAFEAKVERGEVQASFPPEWAEMDDRLDAGEVIAANLKKLAGKDELRRQVMENGSKLDGPYFPANTQRPDGSVYAGTDLPLHYIVTNLNSGHNLPTASLGAQPQLWLNAVVVAPSGRKVWETGYLDSQGDLADIHSIEMHQGKIPFDRQLFNLQTKFLITNVKGTDREIPLPVNIDIDQLPFIRPAPQPVTVINHPPFIRMEAHSLAPLGSRKAHFKIPGAALAEPGVYRLSIRLRSRLEPIYFMKFCESTPEMIRSMNEKILDVHPYTIAFEVR